jgi:hypothetical protein
MDDQRSPLTGLGTAWQGSLYVLDSNGLRLHHNFLQLGAPFFWLLSRHQMEFGSDLRGPPDMTAQATMAPRSMPP